MTTISKLGILDFGGRRSRRPSWTAVNETVRSAQLAERVGYHRYWLAEHQSPGDAWGTAALMVGHLASKTRTLKIGTAGILIGYHDPFDVAAEYRFLESLHPGRIDLGIAGGGPSMFGLHKRHPNNAYLERAEELVDFLRRRPEDLTDPLDVIPVPADVTVDRPWLLGSGGRSRELALRLRTAYCYSVFHTSRIDPAILADYLDRFDGEPTASICAAVICAPTEREALAIRERQSKEIEDRGVNLNAVGDPGQCAAQLDELAQRYRVDEVVIHDVSRTVPERRRAYALVAEAILGARAPALTDIRTSCQPCR